MEVSQEERVQLRQDILSRRDQLKFEAQAAKSKAVTGQLWQLEAFHQAKTIFTYINFRSEVITTELVRQCLSRGKRVCVPLTLPQESKLVAYQLTDPDHDLQPGYCQIPEPDPLKMATVNPAEIDLIILPGSVFDLNGGRLGYGGGYYDRFIANDAPQALRLGLAFELQIKQELPLMPHDQLLHLLVTEKRVLKFKGA